MAKYIDSSEATRLKRLKNIKSTIGNNMSHNGWQKQQIEKRRKDQLRRRKEEAKRKPLGGGIRVDTKISKADAISKCGLKLKAAFITKTQGKTKEMVPLQRKKTYEVVAEQQEEEEEDGEMQPSLRRRYSCDPIERAGNRNNSVMIPELCTLKKTNPSRTKQQKKGKENNDDSNSKECTAAAVDVTVLSTKKTTASSIPSNNKKYFMDIDSLKREHADAMKLLEELDVSEGKNRLNSLLLLDSENNASAASYSGEDDNNNIDGCDNDALDDDLVGDCDDDKSSVSQGLDHAKDQDQTAGEGDNALTDSFLNMSHLSTCLVHRNSLDGDEEVDYHDDETGDDLTPSFTDSDFFGYDDADCNPSTFDGEDDEFDGEDNKSGNASRRSI